MNIFREAANKENKKLNLVFGSIAITLLIAATYFTFSQHPFAIRISSWQTNIINEKNKYFPVLTICLLGLPPLFVLLLIKIMILRMTKSKKEKV